MAVLPDSEERGAAGGSARLAIRRSPVIELVWISYGHSDESAYPARQRFFAANPTIGESMTSVWGDEACFTELAVLANQAGVLFEEDVPTALAAVERTAAAPPRPESLASETPADKLEIRSRIARLHEDPDLRARWLEVIGTVWSSIAAEWEAEGRPYVEAAQFDLRSRLGERIAYGDLDPYIHNKWDGLLQRLLRDAVDGDLEVTLVPAWLARSNLLLSFSDRLLVGPVLAEPPISPTAATRGRARRLKALADPTRLAIFEAVGLRPRTVGELARQLRLSQPTVSNHVRLLRDAGLLTQGKGQLSPDLDAFDSLLRELTRAVTHEC